MQSNIKIYFFVLIFLLFAQLLLIIFYTLKNKKFLDKYKAIEYSLAWKDLYKYKPRDVIVIRVCYGIAVVELIASILIKKIIY